MSEHTPGPWGISPQRTNTLIVAENGTRVAEVYGIYDEEPRANGVLVAAAPVMRDALDEAAAGLEFAVAGGCRCNGGFKCAPHHALDIVRAAIKAAR